MKKISSIATIIGLLLAANVVPALALNSTESRPVLTKTAASEAGEKKLVEIKETTLNTKLDNLKNRAGNEITRRISSLTHVINKITAIKRLTQSQKASLTSGIQAEIESLKLLNTKIQADTDPMTLRTDIKSIIDSYRIYLLYLPQTQIIIAANELLTTADTLTELKAKLQSRINEAKGKGEDVANLETILTDMQAKIADAKTQANNAISVVTTLKPTGYPGNKPELQNARTILQTAHKDLLTARQDAQKIIVELRKLNKDITGTPDIKTPKITKPESEATPTNIPVSTQTTE